MPVNDTFATIGFYSTKGSTNDTSVVEIIADPGAGANTIVIDKESLGVLNRDTAPAQIILTITSGSSQIIETVTLDSGDRWTNPTRIMVEAGESLTIQLNSAVATNQLTWHASYYQITN